jgi:hypothetical protein
MDSYYLSHIMPNNGMQAPQTVPVSVLVAVDESHQRAKEALLKDIKMLWAEIRLLEKRNKIAERAIEDLVRRVRIQSPPPIPVRKEECPVPVRRIEELIPVRKNQSPIPVQKKEEQIPVRKEEVSIPAQKEDGPIPVQMKEEPIPVREKEEMIPTQTKGDLFSVQTKEEPILVQTKAEPIPVQKKEETISAPTKDNGKEQQRRRWLEYLEKKESVGQQDEAGKEEPQYANEGNYNGESDNIHQTHIDQQSKLPTSNHLGNDDRDVGNGEYDNITEEVEEDGTMKRARREVQVGKHWVERWRRQSPSSRKWEMERRADRWDTWLRENCHFNDIIRCGATRGMAKVLKWGREGRLNGVGEVDYLCWWAAHKTDIDFYSNEIEHVDQEFRLGVIRDGRVEKKSQNLIFVVEGDRARLWLVEADGAVVSKS